MSDAGICRNIYGIDSSISEPNNVLGIDKKEVDVVAGIFSRCDVRGMVWFVGVVLHLLAYIWHHINFTTSYIHRAVVFIGFVCFETITLFFSR